MKYIKSIFDNEVLKPLENFLDQEGGVPMFHQKKGMNPLAAGLLGMAIGAAGAVAGLAMTDPKNRKMVADKAKEITTWGNDKMQGLKQSATHVLSDAEDTTEDLKKKANKAAKKS